ncbi:MAG: zinc ribbon domain-containing protein [Clostridiales bacterium]|jgi:hypothetical protein|nr:zinc ribbon domain-containing protein [Clostridiales bacterium]
MYCAECGKPVKDNAQYCGSCGKNIDTGVKFCSVCGFQSPKNGTYCLNCGVKFSRKTRRGKDIPGAASYPVTVQYQKAVYDVIKKFTSAQMPNNGNQLGAYAGGEQLLLTGQEQNNNGAIYPNQISDGYAQQYPQYPQQQYPQYAEQQFYGDPYQPYPYYGAPAPYPYAPAPYPTPYPAPYSYPIPYAPYPAPYPTPYPAPYYSAPIYPAYQPYNYGYPPQRGLSPEAFYQRGMYIPCHERAAREQREAVAEAPKGKKKK